MRSCGAPVGLCVEHYAGDVLGIPYAEPRLSWQYSCEVPCGVEIEVSLVRSVRGGVETVETSVVSCESNVLCQWPFAPLASCERAQVRVRVVSQSGLQSDGVLSPWSDPVTFETGLLQAYERVADFVGPSWPEFETDHRHQPLVRTEVVFDKPVKWARLYLTALGLVEAEINGCKVGSDVLTPGWTDYRNRLLCFTYDISALLQVGANVFGFWLGDGWYRGRVGFDGGEANVWGDRLGVFAQIEVTYADGTTLSVYSNSSDECWKTALGPITRSNMYEGEWYDARLVQLGWSQPGFDDSDWLPVAEIPFDEQRIMFPVFEGIRVDGTGQPLSVESRQVADGSTQWVVDMGQNASRRLRIYMHGLSRGQKVTIRHGEVLDKDGGLVERILKRGKQTDVYISDGGDEWWEPRFTMHGCRYVIISGWVGTLQREDIIGVVYHSSMRRTGWFECSNAMVNQLHDNTLWSMRSNFMSIPTDCPQRDERVGWTADIALFAPTALYLYDATGFLSSWLEDVDYEQRVYGTVPYYVPYVPMGFWAHPTALALWGDVAVMLPWDVYMASGDTHVLEVNYDLARRWLAEVNGYLSDDGVWDRKPELATGQLGDWLDPQAPPDEADRAMTAKELVATAFHAHSCDVMSRIAAVLGHDEDAAYYAERFEYVRQGFMQRFISRDGRMTSDTQCAYALAIMFQLHDEHMTRQLADRLSALVRAADSRVGTGFAGTPYVLPALTQTGHYDEAFSLFLSTKCPSWLYQVSMGATTTWERWDSMLPNGDVNPGSMTSFNHYALGSVNDWVHAVIAGISPLSPGWKRIRVAPRVNGNITHASARHDTPYGPLSIEWKVLDDQLHMRLEVPYGTSAVVNMPGLADEILRGGIYERIYSLPL